jgi:energy-coupling factor transporter ATP-binding protein EcfA2
METLISVRGVSKKFCRDFHKSLWFGVRDIVGEWRGARGKGELREGEFWANRDLSFDVARGRCLGLVGPNGAGKTTLLRLIGGLLKPDAGSITVRGSTGALIALGAGFNPLLTGRENIFISGAIHGMGHKEIRRRFDEIGPPPRWSMRSTRRCKVTRSACACAWASLWRPRWSPTCCCSTRCWRSATRPSATSVTAASASSRSAARSSSSRT